MKVGKILVIVTALAVSSGCASPAVGNPPSPKPSVSTTPGPTGSPTTTKSYPRSQLVRAAERVMTASHDRKVPVVSVVALRHDMTGLTAYFPELPDPVGNLTERLEGIAGLPVSIAQGDAPNPT